MSAIQHADAAIGDETADRARHVGAVDGVFAAGQRHRRDAHRIVRRAAGNHVGHERLVVLDFRGRRPGRIAVLAVDPGGAGPLLAGLADADRDSASRGPDRPPDRAGARWSSPRWFPANSRRGNRPRPAAPAPPSTSTAPPRWWLPAPPQSSSTSISPLSHLGRPNGAVKFDANPAKRAVCPRIFNRAR